MTLDNDVHPPDISIRSGFPLAAEPDTLSALYLRAMRTPRRTTVFRYRDGRLSVDVPNWKFDRQVIRIALFLRERLGVCPGDTVAIVAPLGPVWPLIEFAIVAQGAAAAAIDPAMPNDSIHDALVAIAPQAIFSCRAAHGALRFDPEHSILIDAPPGPSGVVTFAEMLDFGGTLDSAERANAFRERARQVTNDSTAVIQVFLNSIGRARFESLTHAAAVQRLNAIWDQHQPTKGALASCFLDRPVTLDLRLAVYRTVLDAVTTLTFEEVPL